MVSKMQSLLSSRFKKKGEKNSKMDSLAQMTNSGSLSSFSGVFRVTALTEYEEDGLRNLLTEFNDKEISVTDDLKELSAVTSEVKAINNQAAMLHGERVKRAQTILKKYREGAFTAWLMQTYGNRQTPYNFLQYFELYTSTSKVLQHKIDEMPRQAVYSLATRNCPKEAKEEMIREYQGQTKKELLTLIRERFPLSKKDKRSSNPAEHLLFQLKKIEKECATVRTTKSQKQKLLEVLQSIQKKL